MKLRVTTFNCENLFGRYRFLDTPPGEREGGLERLVQIPEVIALEDGRSGKIKPRAIARQQRTTTGAAILAAKPDILAVQEVENLATLRIFNSIYLKNAFDRIMLIDGNDARGIDVGFMVRKGVPVDILDVRSHADEAVGGGFLPGSSRLNTRNTGKAAFSRDCLEIDIAVGKRVVTFMVNHFKAQDGKPASVTRRRNQAARVLELVKMARKAKRLPIVLGDLNIDVEQKDYDGSLDPLLGSPLLFDAVRTAEEHWTHFFASKKTVSRLDYILLDKGLAGGVDGVEIFRRGLSPKCKRFTGPRLPTMDGNGLEASDHCPTTVVLDI